VIAENKQRKGADVRLAEFTTCESCEGTSLLERDEEDVLFKTEGRVFKEHQVEWGVKETKKKTEEKGEEYYPTKGGKRESAQGRQTSKRLHRRKKKRSKRRLVGQEDEHFWCDHLPRSWAA